MADSSPTLSAMDARTNLAAALTAYMEEIKGQPSAGQMLEQLEEIRREVEGSPQPTRQGPGVVPEQRPGSSGARPFFPKEQAIAAMKEAADA